METPTASEPVKRRGRPKGSKNRDKAPLARPAPAVVPSTTTPSTAAPNDTGFMNKRKAPAEALPIDPEWVLTKTINGTPVAIESICRLKNSTAFMVLPNYTEKTYKTVVRSEDLYKPSFSSAEIEKQFDGVVWAEEKKKSSEVVAVEEVKVEDK